MKRLLLLLRIGIYISLFVTICGSKVVAQNIGFGTATPQGTVHIKGKGDTTQLVIDADSLQTNARPLIRLRNAAGSDLLHIHSDAPFNVFMGFTAGRSNKVSVTAQQGLYNTFIGSNCGYYNSTGSFNTGIGRSSLYQNTSATNNTGLGYKALFSTTNGDDNTATGANAMLSNITGTSNVAMGMSSLYANNIGSYNVAVGGNSLFYNSTGSGNTAVGYSALHEQTYNNGGNQWLTGNTAIGNGALFYNNPTTAANGINNTALGNDAMHDNTTGYANTGIGASALSTNKTGYGNTAVGNGANVSLINTNKNTIIGASAAAYGSNNTVIGYNAYTSANNLAQLGSATTQFCGGYANWTNYASDRRIKTGVNEDVKGLDFIMRLRPVTYHLDVKAIHTLWGISVYGKDEDKMTAQMKADMDESIRLKEAIRVSGFIAQEVEAAAQQSGYDFDGIKKPENEKDHYGLTYETFVVPLVKAVQEQQKIIDEKQQQIAVLQQNKLHQQQQIDELKMRLDHIEKLLSSKGN